MSVLGKMSRLCFFNDELCTGVTRLPLLQCWNITALNEENTKMLYSHYWKNCRFTTILHYNSVSVFFKDF